MNDYVISLLGPAFVAAGKGASDDDVCDQLIRLHLMVGDNSPVMKRMQRVTTAQPFVADLVDVTIEASSTRAVLTLSSTTADSEDGLEQIRTDRTDQPDGRRTAEQARLMVGRRVLVFKVMEAIDAQKKVRVCVHLVDIGPARTETPPASRWMSRHWEEAAASSGATEAQILRAAAHYAESHGLPEPRTLDAIDETVATDVRRWLDRKRAQ